MQQCHVTKYAAHAIETRHKGPVLHLVHWPSFGSRVDLTDRVIPFEGYVLWGYDLMDYVCEGLCP